jgi:hypothetical protein
MNGTILRETLQAVLPQFRSDLKCRLSISMSALQLHGTQLRPSFHIIYRYLSTGSFWAIFVGRDIFAVPLFFLMNCVTTAPFWGMTTFF